MLVFFSLLGYIAQYYGYKASLIIAGIFMGLSGGVTIILSILQYLEKRRKDPTREQTIKTHTTTLTSDSSEGEEMKNHHSNFDMH